MLDDGPAFGADGRGFGDRRLIAFYFLTASAKIRRKFDALKMTLQKVCAFDGLDNGGLMILVSDVDAGRS